MKTRYRKEFKQKQDLNNIDSLYTLKYLVNKHYTSELHYTFLITYKTSTWNVIIYTYHNAFLSALLKHKMLAC